MTSNANRNIEIVMAYLEDHSPDFVAEDAYLRDWSQPEEIRGRPPAVAGIGLGWVVGRGRGIGQAGQAGVRWGRGGQADDHQHRRADHEQEYGEVQEVDVGIAEEQPLQGILVQFGHKPSHAQHES